MNITSIAFRHGEEMPKIYTCLGPNINPPLEFENIPAAAKSLVLIFEDKDATPKPWTHWMLFNIKPSVKKILDNTVPSEAMEALSNNHTFGYEGPCPKYFSGTHHYWFRLYALDIVLDIPRGSEREIVETLMKDHIIDKAELLAVCTSHEKITA
jgi:Raf kinase inhibitor-like YbhB/YbcL family protein